MITFSFIIPVKPGGKVAALSALRNLDSSTYPFEVLVAEGCCPSLQRNAAVQASGGGVVCFLDDDSLIQSDWCAVCARGLEDPAVAAVGGPSLTPAGDSPLQQLFGAALSSFFGAGAVRNRYRAVGSDRKTTEKELILCNLAMRREVFLSSGGFDERLYPNEENELLDRVCASGFTLVHSPEMAIHRSQRSTLRQFVRQMFSYGRGRAQQTLITRSISPASFAPLALLFYLALLPFSPITALWLIPLASYLTLDVVFSILSAIASGSVSRMLLLFVFPLLHISNGYGLLYGLCGGRGGVARKAAPEIVVRRVKTFEQQVW